MKKLNFTQRISTSIVFVMMCVLTANAQYPVRVAWCGNQYPYYLGYTELVDKYVGTYDYEIARPYDYENDPSNPMYIYYSWPETFLHYTSANDLATLNDTIVGMSWSMDNDEKGSVLNLGCKPSHQAHNFMSL